MSEKDAEIFEPDLSLIRILRGDPLAYVKERLDRWIVGEEANKMTLFLSKLSYLREEPTHEILKGVSGVGKTCLISRVLDAFPPEDVIRVSRVTPTWLDYMADKLKHKILVVQQMGGIEASQSSFHVMLSERGLTLGTVKRTEEGSWEPYNIETEGPISFVSTTTSFSLDKQMETRTFMITPDDSKEQTERIQKQQMEFDAYPWKREEALNSVREIRQLVSWIRDAGVRNVIIPYSRLIKFPTERVRARRDRKKLIELIKSLAMLRQLNRHIIERGGTYYVLADVQDAKDVIQICGEIIKETATELTSLERRVLKECEVWFKKPVNGKTWFSARDIAGHIGRSQSTVRLCLNNLVEKGYIFLEREGRGRGMCNMYSLGSETEIKGKMLELNSNILDNASVKNELREWVRININNIRRYKYNEEGRLERVLR